MAQEIKRGEIVKVSGPLVIARNLGNAKIYDLVKVGEQKLMGEIIEIRGEEFFIQVYEETIGLGPGDRVYATGEPLSVQLGPGILSSIYDGVQRPLDIIKAKYGNFISRGLEEPGISLSKKWSFEPRVAPGDTLKAGDILGVVKETAVIEHRIMLPPGLEGVVKEIFKGEFTVEEPVAVINTNGLDHPVTMLQKWPVRKARPYQKKLPPDTPLITGQRVIDSFFPMTKGGTASIPGPFGSGKTVVQHQISKWADSEIVVFIGCGERGNEMTDVLIEFPKLTDPNSGKPLMERTILIANTSNMPVAAREASIYTGITIAEYFRDMGYNVALQADSTSRWAEALREISGRLEEMPGEEGFPAYLGTRLASFYERAGKVVCAGRENRVGTITVIGSVSPPGGDLSEPVVQNTLRVVKVFWALEDKLAYERHYPAVNWLVSYSLYKDKIKDYWTKKVDPEFGSYADEAMGILQEEAELREVVRLVGVEALSYEEQLLLETARSIREDFLQQSAFHEVDTFTSLKKQFLMLKSILTFHAQALEAIKKGTPLSEIISFPVRARISRLKYAHEEKMNFEALENEIIESFRKAAPDLEEKKPAEQTENT